MAIANIQAQIANLTSQVSQHIEWTAMQGVPTLDWHDHSNSMWWEPQQVKPEAYWQPYEECYSEPMVSPQQFQPNSGTFMESDEAIRLLTSISQGLQNQDNRIANYEKEMKDMREQIWQICEFLGQIREQGELPSSTNVNPEGGFETAEAITLRSGKEVGIESNTPQSAQKVDEKHQAEEDAVSTPTARIEESLPQDPKPPNSAKQGKLSSNSVISNSIPTNAPFPRRFMQSRKEESEKVMRNILSTQIKPSWCEL